MPEREHDDIRRLDDLRREVSDLSGEFRVHGYRLGQVESEVSRRAPSEDVGKLERILAETRAQMDADRQRLEAAAAAIDDEKAQREDEHRDKDRRADLIKTLTPIFWGTVATVILALLAKYLGLAF